MQNLPGRNSLDTMPPRSDSQTESLIKEWLFRFGVNFQRDVAPCFPLWLEIFGEMNPDALLPLFESAMRTCKFFPTVADVLAPLEMVEETASEDEWQALLDYCRQWVYPDLPARGPRLPADIDHAARAAGGVRYLESCSERDLIFAKQRFLEDLARQRKTGDIAGFLPSSELRGMLEAAAPRFGLPEAQSAAPARRLEHSESVPRPLLRKVERAANLTAMIRQGEAIWRATHGPERPKERAK
jgi:hypothetical protein